jgi:hypothetical protein
MTRAGSRPPRSRAGRASIWAIWATWAAGLALVAIAIATARPGGPSDPASAVLEGGAALMLVTVGSILASRLPSNLVGWLLLIGGVIVAISVSSAGLADEGLNVHAGSLPLAIWLAWLSQWIWAPEMACLFILLPLFYPSGHLPSPRWRAVVVIAGALVVVGSVGSALSPWTPDPYPVGNPLAPGGPISDLVAFSDSVVSTVLVLAGGALAAASLIVRYRRAARIERQQLKWFAAVALIAGVAGTINIGAYIASGAAAPTATLGVIVTVSAFFLYAGVGFLPAAIGLAILRYRLYEIDRLISRTIGWAALTITVVGLFVGAILALQAVLSPVTRSNELAVAGSTLLVFTMFQPLRRRVQRSVDRRFNRAGYDAEQTVAAFAARLADVVDLEDLREQITKTVAETVEPTSVSIWLRG